MINFHWFIILISILYVSSNVEINNQSNLLPQSILELKQYYDVINNLEKRGILNSDIANQEKQLYIKYASKLTGNDKLLTEEEFLTWKQRQIIVSFSNIIAIIAGIIVILALTTFLGIFLIPLLIQIPVIFWEILFYFISFYLMILTHNSWFNFFGCLTFIATLSFAMKLHTSTRNMGLIGSWICFIIWSIVAIYQQNQEIGFLAVMALESSLGFVIFVGELLLIIGFQDEKIIPSATFTSFILIILGSFLHLQSNSNILTIPFTRPLLFLGTFVYFIGLLILTSRFYNCWKERKYIFWILQLIAFISGLTTIFFGPMLEIPFIQAIGGTMFVIWLLQKYIEIAPWEGVFTVTGSLFGFGMLLYGFAYFLQKNPEYFIFHSYNSLK